jgi:geranylgeranyl diphosphate synthase type II
MAPPAYVVEKRQVIDRYIDSYLPSPDQCPEKLHAAVRYSVMAGGKRLRPILALAAFETCGRESDVIYPAAVALELIHTYSLIHDDLPCMDDDDIRRGQPTCHKKFGEAVALLAGDALHDLAFNLMARTGSSKAVLELTESIGTKGMLAGQMADMEAEGREISLDEVIFIHKHKTGRLIRASLRIGAILAGASDDKFEIISGYGEKIGLAFQIIDDILDIEGDTETLGKPIGSDSKNRKATFPAVIGLELSRKTADKLITEAIEIIGQIMPQPESLIQIARYIGGRQN